MIRVKILTYLHTFDVTIVYLQHHIYSINNKSSPYIS